MIPRAIKASIDLYIDTGYPTGSFLYAVLTNDLFEACGRADMVNGHELHDICKYIYNCAPSSCHGTKEKVEAWMKMHKEEPEKAQRIAKASLAGRLSYVY